MPAMMTERTRQNVLHFRHELRPKTPYDRSDEAVRAGEHMRRAQAMGRSFPLYAYTDSVFYRLYLLENYDTIEGVSWRDVAPLLKYELA